MTRKSLFVYFLSFHTNSNVLSQTQTEETTSNLITSNLAICYCYITRRNFQEVLIHKFKVDFSNRLRNIRFWRRKMIIIITFDVISAFCGFCGCLSGTRGNITNSTPVKVVRLGGVETRAGITRNGGNGISAGLWAIPGGALCTFVRQRCGTSSSDTTFSGVL